MVSVLLYAGWGGGRREQGLDTRRPSPPRFSVSNDLKYDAERDLRDIDAPSIAVHALNKVGASPCPSSSLGVPLCSGAHTGLRLSPDQVW